MPDEVSSKDDENDVELDIGRPILRLEKISLSQQLKEQLRIIDEIFEQDDFLLQVRLLDRQLASLLQRTAAKCLQVHI